MAATIVRPEQHRDLHEREHRLAELVRDLSGAPASDVMAAFSQAPPAPAEPLERVAHALVMLRRRGGLRVAGYVPEMSARAARSDDLPARPQLPAGPNWSTRMRDQLMRSRSTSAISDSTQPSGSAKA